MRAIATCTCITAILFSTHAEARIARPALPSVEIHLEVLDYYRGGYGSGLALQQGPSAAMQAPAPRAAYTQPTQIIDKRWYLNEGPQPVADYSRQPDSSALPSRLAPQKSSYGSVPVAPVSSSPEPLIEPWKESTQKAPELPPEPKESKKPEPEKTAAVVEKETTSVEMKKEEESPFMSPDLLGDTGEEELVVLDPALLPDEPEERQETASLALPELGSGPSDDLDDLFADMEATGADVDAKSTELALPEIANEPISTGEDELDALLADIPELADTGSASGEMPAMPDLPELGVETPAGDVPAMPDLPVAAPSNETPASSDDVMGDLFADLPELEESDAELALPVMGDEPQKRMVIRYEATDTDVPLAAQKELDALVETLKAQPGIRVTLLAYAGGDKSQSQAINRTSHIRASRVRDYILEKGIDGERVIPKSGGFGEDGHPDRVDILY